MNKDDLFAGKYTVEKVSSLSVVKSSQTMGWHISKFNLPEIWKTTRGSGVKVAVIDTAADIRHPDITISGGYNFVRNTKLTTRVPRDPHGTHVCGIIGAKDNGRGIIGVAPACTMYNVAVLDDKGSGSFRNIIKALDWCVKEKIDIINMSLGTGMDNKNFYKAIRRAYDAGITIVCAAGNSAWESGYIDFPGVYNETISVAAIKPNMTRAQFSSIGANIDISAPGVNILSCVPKNKYAIMSGTSMASPFVTGIVALLISKHRKLGGSTPINTPEDVRDHLIKVATDVNYIGQDNYTGYGLINPLRSISYEEESNSIKAINPILRNSKKFFNIPFTSSTPITKRVIVKKGKKKTVRIIKQASPNTPTSLLLREDQIFNILRQSKKKKRIFKIT